MKLLISGCTGLVGSALVEYLFERGFSIQCLKRSRSNKESGIWDFESLSSEEDNSFHSIVHLAGENVASGRWTKKKKEQILQSRVAGTKELVDYISLLPVKPASFLCASAVGFYGNSSSGSFDEHSPLGAGFLADVCSQWENETRRLQEMGIRVVNLRFGMILSPNGGALHKMLPAFKLNLGGTISSGKQYISWISIRDVVSIIEFLIKSENIEGPVNIVTPKAITNKELTVALGEALKVLTLFSVPGFIAKTVFGQMADEMLLGSSNVSPKILLDAGYNFRDPVLEKVLDYCIKGL